MNHAIRTIDAAADKHEVSWLTTLVIFRNGQQIEARDTRSHNAAFHAQFAGRDVAAIGSRRVTKIGTMTECLRQIGEQV